MVISHQISDTETSENPRKNGVTQKFLHWHQPYKNTCLGFCTRELFIQWIHKTRVATAHVLYLDSKKSQYDEQSHHFVSSIQYYFFVIIASKGKERGERVNSLNQFLGLLWFPMTSILPRFHHALKNSPTNNFPRVFHIILNSSLSCLGGKISQFPLC